MDYSENPEVDTEVLNSIAGDSISLFRTGLFLIVVYITILSFALQEGEPRIIVNTLESVYTLIGLLLWAGSLVTAIWSYRTARYISLLDEYPQLNRIEDRKIVLNKISAVAIGFLVATISLVFGLLEGWVRTYSETPGGLGVEQPILIVGLGFVFLLGIFGVLSLLDHVRETWGPIREILRLS